ncbi:outer membrane lipoprotein LolB [Piscinibacter sp.]|uniref:outer membrane lipoprotein LolB n=1 Tax=Piscinibacter sp. TaxID=1903157 RepID=UPI0039E5F170
MRRRAFALALPAAALLQACASLRTETQSLAGESLAGRLALRVDTTGEEQARSMVAAFELQGAPETGRLNLATPTGQVMAQARWQPGRVLLVTPQGETPYPSLDALTREVLGESLPVAALFDWLRGRPWPGAGHLAQPDGFRQLGWAVDLSRFADDTIVAVREAAPAVTVRVKLDKR